MIASRIASWTPLDRAVAAYTLAVAGLAIFRSASIRHAPLLVVAHAVLLAALIALPPRGSAWERPRTADPAWLARARRTGRFLRYTYPALLLTFFFEEVQLTVHALGPGHAYWFEPYLYHADRAIFGTTPAIALSSLTVPLADEVMHALYFSYYPLIIGGIVLAWRGEHHRGARPAPGFETTMTSLILGFLLAYVWYPFLPARGPWENDDLMARLPGFDGFFFTPLVRWMIQGVGVSGGCFPSAHVAGLSGLVVGLASTRPRAAAGFGVMAAGMSIACVYTRYHHAVDVAAGLIVGVAGGVIGRAWTRRGGTT